MRIVIEQSDFRQLSPEARREIIEKFGNTTTPPVAKTAKSGQNLRWRQPVDLDEEMATRLMHGLSESPTRRQELFAKKGGRVRQKDLLAVTGDTDMRTLSHFQAVLTRRLRRIFADPDKRAHLIGWDFDSESWDADHKELLDGTYYVTDRTTDALKSHFGIAA
jgi:hypothetical protein